MVISSIFEVDGVAVDPTTITLEILAPDETLLTLLYGADSDLVRDSAGHYHYDLDVTQSGKWLYKWIGTGAAQGVEEGEFRVVRPRLKA